MPDDEKAAAQYFLSGYARRGWVICRKCGETGYWSGYGFAVLLVLYLLMPTCGLWPILVDYLLPLPGITSHPIWLDT
jgi:hypothetical protein